jgi:predicted esterase
LARLGLLCWCAGACAGEAADDEQADYETVRSRLGELWQEERYEEAATLLEDALPRFPDHVQVNAFNLALVRGRLGETASGMEALRYALSRGVWFSVYAFGQPQWDGYREQGGFADILASNDSLRAVAQRHARPGVKVVLPDAYDREGEYPLFIALHGGGGNMEDFSETWESGLLSDSFVVAYLQSSRVASMDGYSWTLDLDVSRAEIVDAYHRLIDDYPIDVEQVVVGGFSAGGIAALDVVLRDTLPAAGFVVLCPGRPDSFTDAAVARMADRGVRGTILTTEMDPNLSVQREMVELLEHAGVQHQFVVTPDVGHWIPEHLDAMIDQAIVHLRSR